MADQKLTALDAATTLGDADLIYVVDDVAGTPASKKLTGADLKGSVTGATHHVVGSDLTAARRKAEPDIWLATDLPENVIENDIVVVRNGGS